MVNLREQPARMGSVTSKTGVVALEVTDQGDNSDTVSENGTGHGSWVSLSVLDRRTASAPAKTRGKSPVSRFRAKTSTDLDQQDMKTDLKRYKKYVLECQNQERISAAKLQEVEKQLAEVEGENLRLQDEMQLLEEKVEYLQEADSQPHNYVEMIKMKDKYIQNLGKETHVIRAEVTQLKAKYKKKLKEKSSQMSEMRQLHCIQMMEIKTEMEKLMEENENLSDQLSRSEHGHAADRPPEGANNKHDSRRNDVIVQLSAKVSEQESRIISLENRLHQREKQLNELMERNKPSRQKQESGDAGDTRRRRDGGAVDRHCQSEMIVADLDKRTSSGGRKHGSESRLASGRLRAWDEAAHDVKNCAKSTGDVVHKPHTVNYMSSRCVRRNHSYSSTTDIDDDDAGWEDEDLLTGDRRNNGFRTSGFCGVVDDPTGRHGHGDPTGRHCHDEPTGRHCHHGYGSRKNKNHNNDLSAADSPKQHHLQRERDDTVTEVAEPTGDSRHAARCHADTTHGTA